MPSDKSFYFNLSYVSATSICIPLIIGLVLKRYLKPDFTILLYLIYADLLAEILSYILLKNNIYNLFVFRTYTIVQFVMLSIFFIKTHTPSKIVLLIKVFIFAFLTVAGFDLYLNGINAMDDLSSTVASILLMIYSLYTLFYMVQNPVHENVLASPLFWFNVAVLLYFSSGLFLFIFSNYLENHHVKTFHVVWVGINSVLNIIFNLVIAIGFWKTKPR